MKIKRFVLGLLQSNGYIIYQQESGSCLMIDPGAKPDYFIDFLTENKLTCHGILLTHHHHDHVGGVDKLMNALDIPVYLHRDDLDIYKKEATPMDGTETFDLDGEAIRVIHTPGHTHGSVCFYSEKSKEAFTGDTLFNVDLGRTDLCDGNQKQMEHSIRNIIDKWSNEITIHPGHGDPCTMKTVRSRNPEYIDIIASK